MRNLTLSGNVLELYLDTSDVAAVKKLARVFPLAGVTTNPGIVAGGEKALDALLSELHAAMSGKGRLFAQVLASAQRRWLRRRADYTR